MDLDPKKMRKRFHELKAKRDAQREKADPVRAERDKVAVRHAKEIAKHNEKVRAAEKGLFEIEMEMGMLVRALGGKMGDPDAIEE